MEEGGEIDKLLSDDALMANLALKSREVAEKFQPLGGIYFFVPYSLHVSYISLPLISRLFLPYIFISKQSSLSTRLMIYNRFWITQFSKLATG